MRRTTSYASLAVAFLTAVAAVSVTLSLSKGEPSTALAADAPLTAPSLLVATHDLLVYVHGDRRDVASAGGAARDYRLIGTMADGRALVAYDDYGMQRVESVAPDLSSHTIKTFGRLPIAILGPTPDGFLAYDSGARLLYRYDANGSLVGRPLVPSGVRNAVGVGDATAVLGNGRLTVYDAGGRPRHETLIDGGLLVAMPGERVAVTDHRFSEVRVYTKDLEQKATLRFPNRALLALAAAPDGALAVLNGRTSCTNPDVEVNVFEDLNAQPTGRTRANVGNAVAVALSEDALYVSTAPCHADEDASIAVFGRDGTPRGTVRILGVPTSLLPFTAAN